MKPATLAQTNDLAIYLDSNIESDISLKDLIKDQFVGSIPINLSLAITLAPNVHATLNDDLIAFTDLKTTKLIKHKLEFLVHQNSTLNYAMKVIPECTDQMSFQVAGAADDNAVVEKELIFRLMGQNAKAYVTSACYAAGSRVFKFNTLQDHRVGDTISRLTVKSVLDDASKLVCNSMILIHKDAQRSDAAQENKNILLGKKARAVSIPQLEIEANDVKCKHGAAVSKLSNEHMFYLQSRGISEAQTREMLIQAFLN